MAMLLLWSILPAQAACPFLKLYQVMWPARLHLLIRGMHMGILRHMFTLFRDAPAKRLFFRSLALADKGGNSVVTSADGTSLSVRCSGQGPSVVLVHGTVDGIAAFAFVEPVLAERYTTWVYDRRGRGGSGDGADYSLAREVEDLCAVLAAAGPRPHVVAHSFGAVIALVAAAKGAEMRSLTLYEAPLMIEHFPYDAAERARSLIEKGDVDEGLCVIIREVAGGSAEELQIAQSVKPAWKQLLDGARVAPRELDVVRDADWVAEKLPVTGVPALVIRGERDVSPIYPTVESLPRFIADADVVTLPNQGHLAITMAPYDFADAVIRFLDRH